MPADSLKAVVDMLVDKLTNDPSASRYAVRWLKQVLKHNIEAVVAIPDVVATLRNAQTSVGKRGSMLPVLSSMRGKLAMCIDTRRQRKAAQGEHADLALMKPLIHIQGGKQVEQQAKPDEPDMDEEDEAEEDGLGIDDELEEDDEEERIYKDAFENEGIDDEEDDDLAGLADEDDEEEDEN